MTDLTDLKTPFGLLDRETQEALKAHGGPYECFFQWEGVYAWRDDRVGGVSIETHSALAWRVKPAPPKPREWWIEVSPSGFTSHAHSQVPEVMDGRNKLIHVREVTTETNSTQGD